MARTNGAFGLVSLAFAILSAALVACAAPDSGGTSLTNGSGDAHQSTNTKLPTSGGNGAGSSNGGGTASGTNGDPASAAAATQPAPPQPTVLDRLESCLDETKFNAIKFETLLTTPRTADNNPGQQVEDADTCMGCNQVQCSSCHSDDSATGFMMAMGNDVLPPDATFTQMKSTKPPYMQKYFSLDSAMMPTASNAIKFKSDVTVNTTLAYEHPMFVLPDTMASAINDFVQDAITKFRNGECGK